MTALEELGAKATSVSRARSAADAAYGELLVAQADLLRSAVEIVKPALRAIGSRVRLAGTTTPEGTTHTLAPWRAVFLGPEGPFKQATKAGSNKGEFCGTSLLVDVADGSLIELSYEGTYDLPRETATWRTRVTVVSAEHVIEQNTSAGERAVSWLATALDDQAGLGARAVGMREKAARLRAAALLLRGTP